MVLRISPSLTFNEFGNSAAGAGRAEQGNHRGLGKRGGRPEKLDRKGPAALKRLATGTTQAECAAILGASVRTIGRAVARMRPWHE
jgi:hypothetical protein